MSFFDAACRAPDSE